MKIDIIKGIMGFLLFGLGAGLGDLGFFLGPGLDFWFGFDLWFGFNFGNGSRGRSRLGGHLGFGCRLGHDRHRNRRGSGWRQAAWRGWYGCR